MLVSTFTILHLVLSVSDSDVLIPLFGGVVVAAAREDEEEEVELLPTNDGCGLGSSITLLSGTGGTGKFYAIFNTVFRGI